MPAQDVAWIPWADPPTSWPRNTTCADCAHFVRDPINPAAGAGRCQAGHGYHWPNELHHCANRVERNETKK